MIRTLIFVGMLTLSLVGLANDKDNGFPMMTASGVWVADNGMTVSIRVSPVDKNHLQAQVNVMVTDDAGNVIGRGSVVGSINRRTPIIVPMADSLGNRFYLMARAVYAAGETDPEKYKLELKFFKTRNSPRSFFNIMVDRWREIKH